MPESAPFERAVRTLLHHWTAMPAHWVDTLCCASAMDETNEACRPDQGAFPGDLLGDTALWPPSSNRIPKHQCNDDGRM